MEHVCSGVACAVHRATASPSAHPLSLHPPPRPPQLYELMIVLFVYPVVAHWVWSPFGWLSAWRTVDSASQQVGAGRRGLGWQGTSRWEPSAGDCAVSQMHCAQQMQNCSKWRMLSTH